MDNRDNNMGKGSMDGKDNMGCMADMAATAEAARILFPVEAQRYAFAAPPEQDRYNPARQFSV